MIHIFNSSGRCLGVFETYGDVFTYITTIDQAQTLQGKPANWSFTRFTHRWVSFLYHDNRKQPPLLEVRQAYEQELELLEICTGDFNSPLYVPLTEQTDYKELQKNWCLSYCHHHLYILLQTFASEAQLLAAHPNARTNNQEGLGKAPLAPPPHSLIVIPPADHPMLKSMEPYIVYANAGAYLCHKPTFQNQLQTTLKTEGSSQ